MVTIDAKTRERISKLPEWAQGLIENLEREATEARHAAEHRAERDENALVTTRLEAGAWDKAVNVKVADDGAEIQFMLNSETGQNIRCQRRYDERRKATYLQVLGNRGIVVRAGSSNLLELQVEN